MKAFWSALARLKKGVQARSACGRERWRWAFRHGLTQCVVAQAVELGGRTRLAARVEVADVPAVVSHRTGRLPPGALVSIRQRDGAQRTGNGNVVKLCLSGLRPRLCWRLLLLMLLLVLLLLLLLCGGRRPRSGAARLLRPGRRRRRSARRRLGVGSEPLGPADGRSAWLRLRPCSGGSSGGRSGSSWLLWAAIIRRVIHGLY